MRPSSAPLFTESPEADGALVQTTPPYRAPLLTQEGKIILYAQTLHLLSNLAPPYPRATAPPKKTKIV